MATMSKQRGNAEASIAKSPSIANDGAQTRFPSDSYKLSGDLAEITSDPGKAKAFLVRAGLLTREGKFAPEYYD